MALRTRAFSKVGSRRRAFVDRSCKTWLERALFLDQASAGHGNSDPEPEGPLDRWSHPWSSVYAANRRWAKPFETALVSYRVPETQDSLYEPTICRLNGLVV